MRTLAYTAALAAFLIVSPVSAQTAPQTTPNAADRVHQHVFAHHAAHSGAAELMLSYLALQKTENPDVRSFSEMMVDHHAAATTDLIKIMGDHPVPVPITPSAEQLQVLQRLSALSGPAFDRAYFEHQVQAHQAAVALYEMGARSAPTAELRRHAAMKLPLLRAHLGIAQMMHQTSAGQPRR